MQRLVEWAESATWGHSRFSEQLASLAGGKFGKEWILVASLWSLDLLFMVA